MTALIAVFIACFGNFKEYVTVGETLAVLCLARDKDQARIVFRYVKAILNHVNTLRSTIAAERNDEIELTSGVTIMVKANDYRGVRGLTLCCVIADEICFWDAIGANPDKEVIAAVKPAMVTIPTAKLLCISSAYAQSGIMYEQWKAHFGKPSNDILVVQAATSQLNPTISEEMIQREIESDPDAGRSEWLGIFRADVSAAFPLEAIENCIIPGRVELPPVPGISYVAFADPSGDSFKTDENNAGKNLIGTVWHNRHNEGSGKKIK